MNPFKCRACIILLSAATLIPPPIPTSAQTNSDPTDLVDRIETSVIWDARETGVSWFHPRACLVPTSQGPAVLMTLQSISGSDLFGQLHCSVCSNPQGKEWTTPEPIEGTQWRRIGPDIDEAVCDMVPEYHPQTGTVLVMGHSVFYKDNKFFNSQPRRQIVYLVRDAAGNWSPLRQLEWNDPRGAEIYTCGCAQRCVLPDGDILVPLSYGNEGRPRSVSTARCSFDGRQVQIEVVGNELRLEVGRGLLEPSVCQVGDRFFMTIRAEDRHGYVTTSMDGLHWQPITPWAWDDGEPITMSTTQQRWLPHSDGLYLVYTRKDKLNEHVMRWRAPLYMAMVDRATLRLVRDTERIVFPLVGDGLKKEDNDVARMGNFHTVAVSPNESWVTVGEAKPLTNYQDGKTLLGRVIWKKPNRTVEWTTTDASTSSLEP